MNKKFFIVIFILLIPFGLLFVSSSEEKLRVDIHIESRCKHSAAFILNQLNSTYESIKNFVDLHIYVFGKSGSFISRSGEMLFACQHGDLECYLNIYQTCVLNLLGSNTDLAVQFVVCAMNFTNLYTDCVNMIELNPLDVFSCVNSSEGFELQLQVENISTPIISQSKRVPTIVYNQVFDMNLSTNSQMDFNRTFFEQLSKMKSWKEVFNSSPILH